MLKQLLSQPNHSFDEVSSTDVPRTLGVYVIYDKRIGKIIYAGRSKDLRRRLLGDHKRGNIDGSQFRKAFGRTLKTTDEKEISESIRQNCTFRYISIEKFEDAVRFEHFITAILAPVFNIKIRQ